MKEGKTTSQSFLVEVFPINKTATQGSLSYFSATRLAPGTIIKVPIRKGFVTAVVWRSRDVKAARSDIRRAGFLLKKIRKTDITLAQIPPESLSAIEKTARYYATSIGALLSTFLPKIFLDEPNTFLKNLSNGKKKKKSPEHFKETLLLQMETEERFGQYRALVRQSFARGASIIFIAPTHLDCLKAAKDLRGGIAEFVHIFTLTGKKSELEKHWVEALREPHPILFITTPMGLFLPRTDIDRVIVERENSRAYRTLTRPFIHFKVFIELWARALNHHLVLGDSILSIETLWREKRGDFGESSLIRWRLPAATSSLVDAKSKQNQNGRFNIITPELKELISKAISENERVYLFGARKGLAPTTVCGDCGTLLPCLNCGAGVVLHRYNETTIYICHACGAKRESKTVCGYCGSWKLVPLGIGTEEIARAAKELFPKQNIQILDKDHAPTDAKAKSIVEKFNEDGGILVGTELAFFHLERVPYSGLVSVDALFSIPDFGINERIFYLVSRLREMTEKWSIIQTRNIKQQVLAWANQGNIIDFYQNEMEERESLLYPPFSIFIKITVAKKSAGRELQGLKERLFKWHPDIFKDGVVIRISRDAWPNDELGAELALLGPQFSIKVDPESIL
ncbi:MAG: hypothetical protein EXS69_02365 [Candidatus Zambryskibacteria bacterium]|nr:hypothetical protein [Candidatus Zambryskibacteria bacterium]